eukprot:CAMPEP_0172670572 /NCGR_PEP_ID=MMETSP1074-20121228/10382_1 /TAXON_ID=2916 /ORGANISM="Ceratium fusus, Strain PA161109" /LENGTH=259 /DNA_ID=CAMNT_0013487501 /DNA_START=43 /DNA_END=822 /DNA_ORIENTATION=+
MAWSSMAWSPAMAQAQLAQSSGIAWHGLPIQAHATVNDAYADSVWDMIYSIDVECVAVGKTHEVTDRSPCQVALVNGHCDVLFNTYIRPPEHVVSCLTPITGVTLADLEHGISLDEAISELKQLLPNDATLVGQNIDSDVSWMQLTPGVDFADLVDIGDIFKGFNPHYGNYSYHSLQHEARVLLRHEPPLGAHDAVWDARASVMLYKIAACATPGELIEMRHRLIAQRPAPSVAKLHNYQIDGVCMAKFMKKFCICGLP